MTRALAAALTLAAASPLFAQAPFPPGPGPYDPAVPTPAGIRGFETGATFSTWRDVERVVDAIAAASDRVRLEPYGTTPEGRTLRLVWVASPERLARLDSLRAANSAFLDGATADLPADHPVFVWLSFGVHGDEAASTEAALELLYHLAAATDPGTVAWLDAAVVVIDPLLNPDGHERYAGWYRSVAGPAPDPDPEAREHRPPWPGGRTNHWYFDLNRDWAWGVQPETRARRAAYLATLPQVHVDFHEMDAGSTYFFFPPAEPVHTLYPESTDRWGRVFGEANARAFDERGWSYYTEEDFDLFYPGYGDSWPSFYGATGMTYEQAGGGAAGVAIDRPGLGRLTLAERVKHHLVAALTTIGTAVEHRAARLADFADFWRSPGRVAPGAPEAWLLPGDDPAARELAALLDAQGLQVDSLAGWRAVADLTAYPHAPRAADSLPPGTLVVRADQPLARYLAAILSPSTALPDTTLFYDVTGWTLPYLFDVPVWTDAGDGDAAPAAPTHRWRPAAAGVEGVGTAPPVAPDDGGPTGSVAVEPVAPAAEDGAPAVALAWPYRSRADVMAAGRLAAEGWRVRVATRGFTAAGRRFPPGSFVLRLSEQPDSLASAPGGAAAAAARAGASAVALSRSRTDDGVDLGSDRVRPLRRPRIALVAGPAASPTSFGAARWLFEAEAGLPMDVVRLADLGAAPGADGDSLAGLGAAPLELGAYSAIVLPDGPGPGAWATALGEPGAQRLESWVEAGGTLVGVGAAAEWLTAEHSGLSRVEPAERPEPDDAERRAPLAERKARALRERIPGTILAADVDTTAALGWGYDDGRAAVLVREPLELRLAERGNAWIYRDQAPLSGYLPAGARERLAGAPWAIVEERGRGRIVLFADDPAFRGIARGTEKAYLNAVLLVPE